VGGARTALFNWLYAKRHGGTFVLRIEDTDAARNTPEALAAILDGLRWLGITWDEGPEVGGNYGPYFQSQRQEIYDRYLQRLQDSGHVYEDGGSIRFRSPKTPVTMQDQVCGEITIDRSHEPDMTLRRPDGSYIFHFVNVVDDIEMAITHVIRGEDHLMNTPKHIELFEALRAPIPVYAHIPLFLNPNGSKMSKRDEGASVSSYQENAFLPAAVINYLCLLGWSSKDDREKLPIEEVIRLFDWEHINRSPSKFDYAKCLWLNSQYLAELDETEFLRLATRWTQDHAAPQAAAAGADLSAALLLCKPKLKQFPELAEHLEMIFNDAAPLDETGRVKVAAQANAQGNIALLTSHLHCVTEWTGEAIQAAIQAAATEAKVKPGALMFPLRLLVTGTGHGVDLLPALVLLGSATVLRRVAQRTALIFPN
jgi:glutamyl-tRNA synthetase